MSNNTLVIEIQEYNKTSSGILIEEAIKPVLNMMSNWIDLPTDFFCTLHADDGTKVGMAYTKDSKPVNAPVEE